MCRLIVVVNYLFSISDAACLEYLFYWIGLAWLGFFEW